MSAYQAAGFSNGILYCNNVNFTNVNKHSGQITGDGQLLIGNAVFPYIRTGVITSPDGSVTVGYSAPDITLSLSGVVGGYVQIDNTDSPYVVGSTDQFISCDSSSGSITIQLPDAPTNFRKIIIKDRSGSAAVNNLTITTVGGAVLIDGMSSRTMSAAFESIQLLFNGTSYEVF